MKTLIAMFFITLCSTAAVAPAFARASATCTEATQSATCICFPSPVGCIDSSDAGNRP